MRQRAALLRTLLFDTDLILLDEPFGALDAQTKLQMQEWLMRLWSDFGKTVLFVTHDVEEAIYLSDEVHVMGTRPGRIIATIPIALPRPRACARARSRLISWPSRSAASSCSPPMDGAGNREPGSETAKRDPRWPFRTAQPLAKWRGSS